MDAVPNAASAAPSRRRRSLASGLLANTQSRARLSWSDLAALPVWATHERDDLERLVCATGTHAHAASLRHCIDGRVLVRLRERLGAATLTALLVGEPEVGAAPLLEPLGIDAESLERLANSTGRDWLLASVAQRNLRDALRECLWPDAGPVLRVINAQAAERVVRTALAACTPGAETPVDDTGSAT